MGWGDTPHTPRQGVEPPAPPEYNQIKHLSKTNRVTPVYEKQMSGWYLEGAPPALCASRGRLQEGAL